MALIAFVAAFVAFIVFLAFIATLPVVLYVSVKFGSDETTFTSVGCQTAPGTGMLGTGTGHGHGALAVHLALALALSPLSLLYMATDGHL